MSKGIQNKQYLKGIRSGDKSAFEQVYMTYYDLLYHLSLQYLGETSIAEEVVQDAFLKLWEVRNDLKPDSNIKNYLYTITKNNCLSQLRKTHLHKTPVSDARFLEMQFNYEALVSIPDNVIEFEELKAKIEASIDSLPDDLREVFIMNRFEDLKYKEIADKLNLSPKTIEARMSKALNRLRTELKDYLPLITLISSIIDQ